MASEANLSDAFIDALLSEHPSQDLPGESRIFEPFIGSWQLVVRWFDANGQVVREEPGEWHFAWVLEGRGVQDIWIVPPRDRRGNGHDYEYGTSIRFYDASVEAWQSTWIGPMHQVVRTFTARGVDGRVVLETIPGATPRMRWSFSDVTPRAFRWSNEVHENGAWRVQQTFEATR